MFSKFSADPTGNTVHSPRPKRRQVSRACDWCRLNRIKCDDSQPCQNCHKRGGHCTRSNEKEPLSLPTANRYLEVLLLSKNTADSLYREIQELRRQITELQEQLKLATQNTNDQVSAYASPAQSNGSVQATTTNPAASHEKSSLSAGKWEGIQLPEGKGGALIHYGPLSSAYFADRMRRYLLEVLRESTSEISFSLSLSQLEQSTGNLLLPSSFDQNQLWNTNLDIDGVRDLEELSRAQEEYFLDLLWQSFHCIYPVILEDEFREYYHSLWTNSADQIKRQPSALVDSILAVCMQYGTSFLTSDGQGSINGYHVEAGSATSRALYRRFQIFILDEIERPSLMTLQSQVYSIVFLYNESSLSSAHISLGSALRTAQMLRLHSKPSHELSSREKQLRHRIWSTLSTLDSQISMALGQSPLIQSCVIDHSSSRDGQEESLISGSMLISPNNEDITWLSFHVQSVHLVSLARGVQNGFHAKCAELLERKALKKIYEDPFSLEELAGVLARNARVVYEWARDVPGSLKIPRKGSGQPLSTERTPLNLDQFSPLWLQRQRILLELLYHHLQMSNFRSFLRFPPGSSSITPLSDCHSINCLNHAVALTNILHQVLTETDLLRGWSAAFQYQWDAGLFILGFVLANPVCPPTPGARNCIQTAIQCLEIMGDYLPLAKRAAQNMREVGAKAEILAERFHNTLSFRRPAKRDYFGQSKVPVARSVMSATVQDLAAPALTPEYLQCLSTEPMFHPVNFLGGSTVPTGDMGDILNGASEAFMAVETDELLAGIQSSWIPLGE